jgi:hypothetical protein
VATNGLPETPEALPVAATGRQAIIVLRATPDPQATTGGGNATTGRDVTTGGGGATTGPAALIVP